MAKYDLCCLGNLTLPDNQKKNLLHSSLASHPFLSLPFGGVNERKKEIPIWSCQEISSSPSSATFSFENKKLSPSPIGRGPVKLIVLRFAPPFGCPQKSQTTPARDRPKSLKQANASAMKNAPICLFHLNLFKKKFILRPLQLPEPSLISFVENEKLKATTKLIRSQLSGSSIPLKKKKVTKHIFHVHSTIWLLLNNFMSVEI